MAHGPKYIFVQCECPRCHKWYHAEILREDPPVKKGKRYLMKCWLCSKANKPQWIKDWVDNQKNWRVE